MLYQRHAVLFDHVEIEVLCSLFINTHLNVSAEHEESKPDKRIEPVDAEYDIT